MTAYETYKRFLPSQLAAALLAACGGAGQGFDLRDPNSVTEPMDGWTARSCVGDAPLICITGPNDEMGLVELLLSPRTTLPSKPWPRTSFLPWRPIELPDAVPAT